MRRYCPLFCAQTRLFFRSMLCGSIALQGVFWIGLTWEVEPSVRVMRHGQNVTSVSNWQAGNLLVAAAFWCITFGLLNISIVWAEIAYVTQHMLTHRVARNIKIYRKSVLAYYLVFGTMVIVITIMDRADLLTYLVTGPILILIASYLWGYFKLKHILDHTNQDSTPSSRIDSWETQEASRRCASSFQETVQHSSKRIFLSIRTYMYRNVFLGC